MTAHQLEYVTWLNRGRASIFNVLTGVIVAIPLLIAVAAAALTTRVSSATALLAMLVIVAPWLVIAATVRLLWTPHARRFPSQAIGAGAVGKGYQSFSLGGLSQFNNCVHIITDEQCLHLVSMALLRWCGARRISIPWTGIREVKPGFWRGTVRAKVNERWMAGPRWCLNLASAPSL